MSSTISMIRRNQKMNSIEFADKCIPYNLKYLELFGYAPFPSDYACTTDEYLEALMKAVEEKKEISNYLPVRALHVDGNFD